MGVFLRSRTMLARSSLLVLGVVLTSLVFAGVYLLFLSAFDLLYGASKEIRDVWDVLRFSSLEDALVFFASYAPALSAQPGNPSIGIFFYWTFFPTLWVFGLLGAALLLRMYGAITGRISTLPRFLNIDAQPLQTLGLLLSIVVALVGVVVVLVP